MVDRVKHSRTLSGTSKTKDEPAVSWLDRAVGCAHLMSYDRLGSALSQSPSAPSGGTAARTRTVAVCCPLHMRHRASPERGEDHSTGLYRLAR